MNLEIQSYVSFLPRHLVREVCAGNVASTEASRIETRGTRQG